MTHHQLDGPSFTASFLALPEMPHGVFVARIGDQVLRFAR